MSSIAMRGFPVAGKPREKEKYIREALETAKETRTHMFMGFFMHDRVLFQLKGACQEVRDDRIYVYLREEMEYLPAKGMKVHVYFSLRSDHKSMPFDFNTTLLDTERHNRNDFLVLALPAVMSHQQRRFNVRISVKKDEIGDFKIWFGRQGFQDPHGTAGKRKWVPVDPNCVDIYDISAGGMQIGIARKSDIYPMLSRQSVFLISGNFFIKGKEASPLIMAGNVVRLQDDKDLPYSILGISYRQWAKVSREGLQWVTMTVQDGVSPLASWVFQAIMDRYKLEREGNLPVDI